MHVRRSIDATSSWNTNPVRFNSRFRRGGGTKSEGRKINGWCGTESDPSERASTVARSEHVQSGRAWLKSASAPEPCRPSRESLHHRLLSDLVLHTRRWGSGFHQHRCRDGPGTTASTSLLQNQNRLLNRPHAHQPAAGSRHQTNGLAGRDGGPPKQLTEDGSSEPEE